MSGLRDMRFPWTPWKRHVTVWRPYRQQTSRSGSSNSSGSSARNSKMGLPSARQICRTDFVIHMSVAFDGLKWNAKAADNLFQRTQTMPASEAKIWKEAFESLLKKKIGQTDTSNLRWRAEWAVPLVLIPVDALFEGQKYSPDRARSIWLA